MATADDGTDATIAARVDALDAGPLAAALDARGWATTGPLLTAEDCTRLSRLYEEDPLFRSTVAMARHGFGRGEYRYFAYPLPELVAALRTAFYRRLAPIAESWRLRLGASGEAFPPAHQDYLARCHAAGQSRPTPLLLRYGPGDYNNLHQDLYGDLHFPLQAAILLDAPHTDFEGGEFVLTEQRPRMQSRVHVVPLVQGEAVIFAVNQRPATGARGAYRVTMRHGVSPIRSGRRHTLGLIFHDAG